MITEEQLAALLDRYAMTDPGDRAGIESEIMDAITEYFELVLRPALRQQFGSSAQDTSVRYTTMVNDFFVNVLEKRPDQFWRANSLRALRAFASRAIANDIRDVLRRQRHRDSIGDEALCELANSRAAHFQAQHGLDFEKVLMRLKAWIESGGGRQRWAYVILHRYSDGMRYDEIAEQLGVSPKTIQNMRSRALKELRDDLA